MLPCASGSTATAEVTTPRQVREGLNFSYVKQYRIPARSSRRFSEQNAMNRDSRCRSSGHNGDSRRLTWRPTHQRRLRYIRVGAGADGAGEISQWTWLHNTRHPWTVASPRPVNALARVRAVGL